MSLWEIVALALAGLAAGTINTVVGSGTLITFPILLAFGYAPVTANVSNTVGLVPGSISGAIGYRRELAGQRGRALRLGGMSVLGGITGAVLLLVAPALEWHPTNEVVLRYLDGGIDIRRVGIGLKWRRGIEVMFRTGARRH